MAGPFIVTVPLDIRIKRDGKVFIEFEDAEIEIRVYKWADAALNYVIVALTAYGVTIKRGDKLFDPLAAEIVAAHNAEISRAVQAALDEANSPETRGDRRYHERRG